MPVILAALMLCLLLRAEAAMSAASAACRLFVTAVLPGLFPYMTLSLMLTSRLSNRMSPALLTLLGWGGGSPTGAKLLGLCPDMTRRHRIRLAVSCATMSPMFLLGTIGGWLQSAAAGLTVLGSVLLGGLGTGLLAGCFVRDRATCPAFAPADTQPPLSFGEAVEAAARTMLLVCGTMVMLRVFAGLAAQLLPSAALPLVTLLEVTAGAQQIAGLPLPLPLRTALIAGATGFGGMAVLLQNRAVYAKGFLPLSLQLLWQGVHGALSFVFALGTMLLFC